MQLVTFHINKIPVTMSPTWIAAVYPSRESAELSVVGWGSAWKIDESHDEAVKLWEKALGERPVVFPGPFGGWINPVVEAAALKLKPSLDPLLDPTKVCVGDVWRDDNRLYFVLDASSTWVQFAVGKESGCNGGCSLEEFLPVEGDPMCLLFRIPEDQR